MADVRRIEGFAKQYPPQKGMPPAESLLSEDERDFLDWLIDPQREGNQKEWADARGIRPQRITEWKRKPYFQKAWRDLADRVNGGPERVQKLMDTLYQQALAGDTKSADIYFRQVDKTSPPRKHVAETGDLRDMSDEDFRAKLAEFLKGA